MSTLVHATAERLSLIRVDPYRSDVWEMTPAGGRLRRLGYVVRDAYGWAVCARISRPVGRGRIKVATETHSRWFLRVSAEADLLTLARLVVLR